MFSNVIISEISFNWLSSPAHSCKSSQEMDLECVFGWILLLLTSQYWSDAKEERREGEGEGTSCQYPRREKESNWNITMLLLITSQASCTWSTYARCVGIAVLSSSQSHRGGGDFERECVCGTVCSSPAAGHLWWTHKGPHCQKKLGQWQLSQMGGNLVWTYKLHVPV